MRQLFVPACLCLMTLSNSTGFDLPLEKFPRAANFDKKSLSRTVATRSADDHSKGAVVDDESVFSDAGKDGSVEGPGPGDFSSVDPRKIPLPPVLKPIVPRSREEICQTLSKAARNNDLPLSFFIRLLFQESRFQPGAVSAAGAQGIAQFMPETSASEGVDNPFDPLQAIPASARLLRKLTAQFGNLGLAAAAYNAGPKRIQDWLEKKGKLPEETQGYVKTVTGRPAETWKVASASGTALSVPHHAPCKEAVPPMPNPAPRARTVTASVDVGKTAASSHGHDASEKAQANSHRQSKTRSAAHKTAAKAGKAVKPPAHQRHKAPTQQLAARKHEREAQKSTKIAQK